MVGFLGGGKPKLTFVGQEQTWQWRGHRVVYSVLGEGAPLILAHSINAAAWSYDWRSNAEELAKAYRVYVPCAPGFGRSERKPMRYTADLYIDFHTDFARMVATRERRTPAVIASSLTAAHIISATAHAPELFSTLVLVAPTGLERLYLPQTERGRKLYDRLTGRVGGALYWLLTSRPSMRRFLRSDGYYDPQAIDPAMVEAYHVSAHQPNAKYAPYGFITFALNHDVHHEWPQVSTPTLIVWGRHATRTPVANADLFLKLRPDSALHIFEDGKLAVYDECAAAFNTLVCGWLADHHSTHKTTLAA